MIGCHDPGVEPVGQRPSYEELAELVASQGATIERLTAWVGELEAEVGELRRRLGSNSPLCTSFTNDHGQDGWLSAGVSIAA